MKIATDHYETFRRYALLPRNRWLNIFVHVYFSKREIPYHDHPWANVTIKLRGEARETLIPDFMSLNRGRTIDVSDRRIIFRKATTAHKMVAVKLPLWTLFITWRQWNLGLGQYK